MNFLLSCSLLLVCTQAPYTSGASNANSALDVWRFPWTPAECERRWELACGHENLIRTIRPWYVDDDWIDEAGWRRECWYYLKEAKRDSFTITSLNSLRQRIGDSNYKLGIMPDYLPARKFVERGERGGNP